MRPTPSPRLRGLSSLGLVLAALLASTGGVVAGSATPPPPPAWSGKVGTFRLVESQQVPAVVCAYDDPAGFDGNNFLYRMSTVAPRVKAAAGRTSQKVTWRLVVQGWQDTENRWFPYARSTWTSGTAKAAKAAILANRSVRLHTVDDPPLTTNGVRAKAEIRWYAANGTTITGRGSVWATWYTIHEPPVADFTSANPRCGETTG